MQLSLHLDAALQGNETINQISLSLSLSLSLSDESICYAGPMTWLLLIV